MANLELRHFRALVNEILEDSNLSRDMAESCAHQLLYGGRDV